MSDDYRSDEWILNMFQGWYDPCPFKTPKRERHGLSRPWQYRNYINPPYSDPAPWIARAIEEYKAGNICVLLLKVDTSTKWYKDLVEAGAHFLFIHGRLKYNTDQASPFPSMLAVLS